MSILNYAKQSSWPNGFGFQQSPIDLRQATTTVDTDMTILTPWMTDQEIDDQVTIRLAGQGKTRINETTWTFVQAHFHVPAEHIVAEKTVAELHFVHQSAIGALCVVAVLVPVGQANPIMADVLDHFQPHVTQPINFDLTRLLPKQGTVYQYLGSLTTPPLTEGVTWYVIEQTEITMSSNQVARYQQFFEPNNRHVQAINRRPIFRGVFKQLKRPAGDDPLHG